MGDDHREPEPEPESELELEPESAAAADRGVSASADAAADCDVSASADADADAIDTVGAGVDADVDAPEQARADPRTAVTCSACGTTAAQQPMTWSMGHGPRGNTLTCDGCTRTHLRAMEAKLDEEFW